MQNLSALKAKGQAGVELLLKTGRQQPAEVKVWGMTVAAAVVGGVTVAAVAKGVMAVVATLATPPVAVTVGALAGGALGWSFVQSRVDKNQDASSSAAMVDTPHESGAEEAAESLSES